MDENINLKRGETAGFFQDISLKANPVFTPNTLVLVLVASGSWTDTETVFFRVSHQIVELDPERSSRTEAGNLQLLSDDLEVTDSLLDRFIDSGSAGASFGHREPSFTG